MKITKAESKRKPVPTMTIGEIEKKMRALAVDLAFGQRAINLWKQVLHPDVNNAKMEAITNSAIELLKEIEKRKKG